MARINVLKTYKNFIGGKFPRTESGRYFQIKNQNQELLANICLSSRKDFRNAVLKSIRRMLLDKANQLGGSDLVNKWIGLHVIGAKQEEIKKIAQESGYL